MNLIQEYREEIRNEKNELTRPKKRRKGGGRRYLEGFGWNEIEEARECRIEIRREERRGFEGSFIAELGDRVWHGNGESVTPLPIILRRVYGWGVTIVLPMETRQRLASRQSWWLEISGLVTESMYLDALGFTGSLSFWQCYCLYFSFSGPQAY